MSRNRSSSSVIILSGVSSSPEEKKALKELAKILSNKKPNDIKVDERFIKLCALISIKKDDKIELNPDKKKIVGEHLTVDQRAKLYNIINTNDAAKEKLLDFISTSNKTKVIENEKKPLSPEFKLISELTTLVNVAPILEERFMTLSAQMFNLLHEGKLEIKPNMKEKINAYIDLGYFDWDQIQKIGNTLSEKTKNPKLEKLFLDSLCGNTVDDEVKRDVSMVSQRVGLTVDSSGLQPAIDDIARNIKTITEDMSKKNSLTSDNFDKEMQKLARESGHPIVIISDKSSPKIYGVDKGINVNAIPRLNDTQFIYQSDNKFIPLKLDGSIKTIKGVLEVLNPSVPKAPEVSNVEPTTPQFKR